MFRIKSESVVSVPDINEVLEYKKPKDIAKISLDKANELIADGAVLLDVESADEYKTVTLTERSMRHTLKYTSLYQALFLIRSKK